MLSRVLRLVPPSVPFLGSSNVILRLRSKPRLQSFHRTRRRSLKSACASLLSLLAFISRKTREPGTTFQRLLVYATKLSDRLLSNGIRVSALVPGKRLPEHAFSIFGRRVIQRQLPRPEPPELAWAPAIFPACATCDPAGLVPASPVPSIPQARCARDETPCRLYARHSLSWLIQSPITASNLPPPQAPPKPTSSAGQAIKAACRGCAIHIGISCGASAV